MDPRLSVLIVAGETTGHVAQSIEQVRGCVGLELELLVLCSPSISRPVLDRMQATWPPPAVRCVVAGGAAPAALRNAGAEAAAGELLMFLEAGDTIEREYVDIASHLLASRPELAFVTAWARRPGAAGLTALFRPTLTLDAVLGNGDPIPGPTVLRRSVWETVGRFDQSLPSHEWYDLWIRILAGGGRGEVIAQPLIGHDPSRQSAYRLGLSRERSVTGMRAVLEKHEALFRHHVLGALCDREISLRALSVRYRQLLAQRDELVAERAALTQQLERTSEELRDLHAEGFDWGDLRRVLPVSPDWGYERGVPIDRYYIERFLDSHAADVRGVVLEVQEADYTRRFGGDRVVRSDVIDLNADNPRANLTGDLRRLEPIPADSYDCFVLTQTIHVIDDMRAVLRQAVRVLKPGGVLLVTLPCTSRVCLEYGRDGDFWRVTEAGARQLFADLLPSSHFQLQTFGNVLTNVAFLEGLACHELSVEEFEFYDPFHPLLVGVRAVKPGAAPEILCPRPSSARGVILMYHRVAEPTLDIHQLAVRPEDFRSHMTHVAQRYRPMPLAQLAAAAAEGWLPEHAVAVTFDDGYVDNLAIASPILLELGIPATFFLTSTGLLEGEAFWWDALASIFFGPAPIPARLEIEANGTQVSLPTATPEQREQAHWELYHRIRKAEPQPRRALTQRVAQWAGMARADDGARPMSREQVEDLARRPGHSVGGHGTDHLSFSQHPPEVVRRDVRENRTLLEATTGRLVTSFAYPFGDHDDRSVAIVGELGYRTAVTCKEAVVRAGADPLRLPRIAVIPAPFSLFMEKLEALLVTGGS